MIRSDSLRFLRRKVLSPGLHKESGVTACLSAGRLWHMEYAVRIRLCRSSFAGGGGNSLSFFFSILKNTDRHRFSTDVALPPSFGLLILALASLFEPGSLLSQPLGGLPLAPPRSHFQRNCGNGLSNRRISNNLISNTIVLR